MQNVADIIAKELNIKLIQVQNTIKLIDDNNTIPFIARYRKEMTGGLDDITLRDLYDRLIYVRNLNQRKEDVIRLIDEQGKLTDELSNKILQANTLQEVEDFYRPYKQKRRTRASIAKENGLEPLANDILNQKIISGDFEVLVSKYLNDNVKTVQDAINGAKDIIAENISDNAMYRKKIRKMFISDGIIKSKSKIDEESVYGMYYDYSEPVSKIPGHRILAINRGEKEDVLSVKTDVDNEKIINYLNNEVVFNKKAVTTHYLYEAIEESYNRLISPSIEREIRSEITQNAQENAIKVFAENLKNLLMQPPIKGSVVLGLDPAYRTGCKIAVVDDIGNVLHTGVIYPTPPQNKKEEAIKVIDELITKYKITIVAIGNGTASRETETFVADYIKQKNQNINYIIVNEAGASVYSASKLASEEFPEFDVSLRSAVSIARRLQDPLAELVKIDPKSIGVGQYQHDMNQKRLGESLGGVVENCVNNVGVDLNTASASLLSYVAGINSSVAKNIIKFRDEIGKFDKRTQLKKVQKLGGKAFEQCAGFLRISNSKEYLDRTAVHPESYNIAKSLLKRLGYELSDIGTDKIKDIRNKIKCLGLDEIGNNLGVGILTLNDIISELLKPGRDPRDELPKPILQSDVLEIEDIKEGMILKGTVRNVADFGAFVDIGVHQDGLVHISQISNKYIKSPMDILSVGDIVSVKVIGINITQKRISLSMKDV